MSGTSGATVRGSGALAGYLLVNDFPCPTLGCGERLRQWAHPGEYRLAYAHGEGEALHFVDGNAFVQWLIQGDRYADSVDAVARWLERLHREAQ